MADDPNSNTPPETLLCYLHNISQVKTATESKRKYFNCVVQCDNRALRGVCFSPEKRSEMSAVATTKSPVKIKNFKRARNDENNVTITKYTTITPVEQGEVDFAFSEELSQSATGEPVSVSSVSNLVSEQLITIKGKVLKVSGQKVQATRFGRVRKQDVIVADPSGYIKLVLWGDFVNTLDVDHTYVLKNVRIKCTRFENYLNTPKNEEFSAVESAVFDAPVAAYEHEIDTTTEVMAKIIGVQQASKTLSCNGCQKQGLEILSSNKAVCRFCKLQQLPSTCNVNWNLRILVKQQDQSTKNLQMRLDHTTTESLLRMLNATYDLQSATEDDIVATILENYETLYYFTYDFLTGQVTQVV
ncbi:uncharacterized protein LOC114523994 [Dendronephthya gigantea]|uniref:uncharacterized protein LOC114523994 n=1 Tax=Dendronephthya gigantea TaxID=151771 RepID=UPI00106CBED4|nr:uncharacterized protein LOC114523994 [Dendronephthya gigantea]